MKTTKINKLKNIDFQVNEAFKTLRTNIQFCGEENKVIGITSCIPNEGKSVVSLNLAVSMEEAGKKVIFIDADLRRSVISGRCKIANPVKGLSHYLSGINTLDEITIKGYYEGLHMILAGPVPPNPSELLGNQKFNELINQCKQNYDYVIIDTPPLGGVIDGAVIAKKCDGMILVIEANKISYKLASNVKAQLEKTGCNILGVVLNKVDNKKKSYSSKYYEKYYETLST